MNKERFREESCNSFYAVKFPQKSNQIKKTIFLIILGILISGCGSVGYMTMTEHNYKTGESTKIEYSPVFSSDSLLLPEDLELRVNTTIMKTTGLFSSNLESEATALVRIKNNSQHIHTCNFKKIVIDDQGFYFDAPDIILKPGEAVDSKEISVKVPTYNDTFYLILFYELNSQYTSKNFTMKRLKVQELKNN